MSARRDLIEAAFVLLKHSTISTGDLRNFEGYMYVVLRNLHSSRYRRKRRHVPLPILDYDLRASRTGGHRLVARWWSPIDSGRSAEAVRAQRDVALGQRDPSAVVSRILPAGARLPRFSSLHGKL